MQKNSIEVSESQFLSLTKQHGSLEESFQKDRKNMAELM